MLENKNIWNEVVRVVISASELHWWSRILLGGGACRYDNGTNSFVRCYESSQVGFARSIKRFKYKLEFCSRTTSIKNAALL